MKAPGRIIAFNGPPYSGKDSLGAMLYSTFGRELDSRDSIAAMTEKFARPIKHAIRHAWSLSYEERLMYFESPEKDQPSTRFFGETPRNVQISFSEQWMKPMFGLDVFGRLCAQRISAAFFDVKAIQNIIITDCGFEAELAAVVEAFPETRIDLIHLYRKGCSFDNDSRGYVGFIQSHVAPHRVMHRIHNDGNMPDTLDAILVALGHTELL